MLVRTVRLITLLLAALALTMESAHVLELPQKLQYDATMYASVNGTLYRYFAIVGGAYQIASIAAITVLAFLIRDRRPALGWTAAAACGFAAAFGLWMLIVAPVNRLIALAVRERPDAVPALWMELRGRWEYGHVAGFVCQVLAFTALLLSVLTETTARAPVPDRAVHPLPMRRAPDPYGTVPTATTNSPGIANPSPTR